MTPSEACTVAASGARQGWRLDVGQARVIAARHPVPVPPRPSHGRTFHVECARSASVLDRENCAPSIPPVYLPRSFVTALAQPTGSSGTQRATMGSCRGQVRESVAERRGLKGFDRRYRACAQKLRTECARGSSCITVAVRTGTANRSATSPASGRATQQLVTGHPRTRPGPSDSAESSSDREDL